MSSLKAPDGRPIVWKPQKGQLLPFMVPGIVKEILLHGNRGSGKSEILLRLFDRYVGCGYGSNWRGMIFKRTNPETDALFERARILFQAICPEVKCTTHPYKVFRWPTGEMLTIRHMYDLSDYDAVHGTEVGFLGYDELTTWPNLEVYLKTLSLLRSSHPKVSQHLHAVSTTNPGGPGNGSVLKRWKLHDRANDKKLIYDSVDDNEELAKWKDDPLVNLQSRPRISIFIDVRQNEIFMRANPTYLADLAAQAPNDSVRRAWIDGDWSVVAGGMFSDLFEKRYHVLKPFSIPRSWRIDRAMDWGSSTPFAVLWFAESDGSDYINADGEWCSTVAGDIFIIYEWYGSNGQVNTGLKLTAREVAYGIVEREIEWKIYQRCVPGPADNQITQQFQAGQSIALDMLQPIRLPDGTEVEGVAWTRSDKNSGGGTRITGWSMIRDRLKNGHPNENGRPREQPGLFIFDRCTDVLEHFPNAPRDEKNVEDLPKRGEYHIPDVIRYRVLDSGAAMKQGRTKGMS